MCETEQVYDIGYTHFYNMVTNLSHTRVYHGFDNKLRENEMTEYGIS